MGLLAVVTLPATTGMADDAVQNTFAFVGGSDATSEATLEAVGNGLVTFYNGDHGATLQSIGSWLNGSRSRVADAAIIRWYDITGHLDGSPHGSPIYEDTFTLVAEAASQTPHPSEVACVLTLEAHGRENQRVETADGIDTGTQVDRPRQRYTGRLYLGPLNHRGDSHTDGICRPDEFLLEPVRDAADTFATWAITASGGELTWGVWSRKDEAIRSIGAVSTDNAWDTQRRRGVAPTVRNRTVLAVSASVELAA